MNRVVTLQVNTAGAWRNVMTFSSHRTNDVRKALKPLQAVLGSTAKWCFLHDDRRREWLDQPITTEPHGSN